MKPAEFLFALWGGEEELEHGYALIWTLQDKKSQWFKNLTEAGKACAAAQKTKDVYFGIGLSKEPLGHNRRCAKDEIHGLYGLHVDIDYAHKAHKKTNVFPSIEDATEFVKTVVPPFLKPSIIVHTGHGIHAHWLFREPLIFESDEEREEGANLLAGFIYTMKEHAKQRGWVIDSTFDLSRVLRIPGTKNHKVKGAVKEVKAIESSQSRYNPDDFAEFIIPMPEGGYSEKLEADPKSNPLNITVSSYARPNTERLETMMQVSAKFKRSFLMEDRKSKESKGEHVSASEYDMSLANIAADYGWPVQEIANLLIYFRATQFGRDTAEHRKGLRVDYLNRTIMKAIKSLEKQQAAEKLDECHMELRQHMESPDTCAVPSHRTIKDELQTVLGIKLNRLWKYLGENPQYEMELENGTKIMLGDVNMLINQGKLRAVIAAHCGLLIERVKPQVWDKYAQLMLFACDEKVTGEDTSDRSMMVQLVRHYIDQQVISENWQEAHINEIPFRREGKTYIFGPAFRLWINTNADKMSMRQFGMAMARIGAENKAMKFKSRKGEAETETSRSVYDVSGIVGRVVPPILKEKKKNLIRFPDKEECDASGLGTESPKAFDQGDAGASS